MSYLISMRDSHIGSSLREGNLRGESRWERQAAEALIESGKSVYCLQSGSWSSGKPGNFNFGGTKNLSNTVAIAHDFSEDFSRSKYKACIFNMYVCHPLAVKADLIKLYTDIYGKGVIFTHGYYKDEPQVNEIGKYVPAENIEFLGAPSAPKVYESQDNFNKKRILWISRGVHLHTFPGRENPYLDLYAAWLKEKLEADSQLELVIVTGLSQADMDWQGWKCTVEQRIFESPIMHKLNHVKNRIKVQTACGWDTILDIMADTKLAVSLDPTRFGGPPVESGMYGLPYVSPSGPTAFMSVPDYLYTTSYSDLVEKYDNLFNDHSYYREHGDKAREHVKKHHTYEAFRNRLSEILSSRGAA